MAEQGPSIFNSKATEKLRSPDDLDKYVRVTSPSVWVVLGACIALLLGLFAWGFFGAVSTSVTATGVVVNGEAMCFLSADDVSHVTEGDLALVGGEQMKVSGVAAIPLSREEAQSVLSSDYLVATLLSGDWAYRVDFSGNTSELTEGVPVATTITTERVAPISLVFGK